MSRTSTSEDSPLISFTINRPICEKSILNYDIILYVICLFIQPFDDILIRYDKSDKKYRINQSKKKKMCMIKTSYLFRIKQYNKHHLYPEMYDHNLLVERLYIYLYML
jgi:hypothetical protein